MPLEGIRVLDSTYVFALPYAGGLLADMGAEVIKVEGPGRPDVTRTGGYSGVFAENDVGEDWWNRPSTYNLIHRGKQSITLDMTDERGRESVPRAGDGLRRGDGELHAPGDAELGAGLPQYAQAAARRDPGVEHRVRAWRRAILGVSGAGDDAGGDPRALLGHRLPDGEGPAKAGASFVDFLSTWTALFAIGAALRYRSRTGLGQWVDMGMYQAGVMFLSEYMLDAIANGREGGRIGNRHPWRAPQGCYPAAGQDQWITLSVGDDAQWRAFCRVMGQPELAIRRAVRTSVIGRRENHDALDEVIAAWTSTRDRYDTMHALQAEGIPSGPVLTGRDIHYDPHFKSRNFLERVQYPPERKLGERMFLSRPVQVLQESAAHPGAVAGLRTAQRAGPEGPAGRAGGSVSATGGGRGHHVRCRLPGEPSPVTPQSGGAEAGHHRRVGSGLPRAAGAGGVDP